MRHPRKGNAKKPHDRAHAIVAERKRAARRAKRSEAAR